LSRPKEVGVPKKIALEQSSKAFEIGIPDLIPYFLAK
jgi:hypothetical protein